jgi:hypothetical protein
MIDVVLAGDNAVVVGLDRKRVPITVYGVLPPNAATTAVDALRAAGPPAFEMAIV